MNKLCTSCGKEIISGRSDKLYCSVACKNKKQYKKTKKEILYQFVYKYMYEQYHLLDQELGSQSGWQVAELEAMQARGFIDGICSRAQEEQGKLHLFLDDIVYYVAEKQLFLRRIDNDKGGEKLLQPEPPLAARDLPQASYQ